jgi:hypothetical protein
MRAVCGSARRIRRGHERGGHRRPPPAWERKVATSDPASGEPRGAAHRAVVSVRQPTATAASPAAMTATTVAHCTGLAPPQ